MFKNIKYESKLTRIQEAEEEFERKGTVILNLKKSKIE